MLRSFSSAVRPWDLHPALLSLCSACLEGDKEACVECPLGKRVESPRSRIRMNCKAEAITTRSEQHVTVRIRKVVYLSETFPDQACGTSTAETSTATFECLTRSRNDLAYQACYIPCNVPCTVLWFAWQLWMGADVLTIPLQSCLV